MLRHPTIPTHPKIAAMMGSGPWNFTASAGVDSITIVANGDDWDVTMTVSGAPTTVTYTTADLEADAAHIMIEPVITGTSAYTADGLGYWFWPTSINGLVEFSPAWEIDDVVKSPYPGLTYTKSGSDDYAKIEFVVSCNYAADVVVEAQAASSPPVNAVLATASSYLTWSDSGGLPTKFILAGSLTVPAGTTGSWATWRINGADPRIYQYLTSARKIYTYVTSSAGSIMGGLSQSAAVPDDTAIGFIMMIENNDTVKIVYKIGGSAAVIITGSALPGVEKIEFAGTRTLTLNSGNGSPGPLVYHKLAVWHPSVMPDASDLSDALFLSTGLPKPAAGINTFIGVDPIVDMYGPASEYTAGTHHGTAGGTLTVTGTWSDWP